MKYIINRAERMIITDYYIPYTGVLSNYFEEDNDFLGGIDKCALFKAIENLQLINEFKE